MSMIIIFSLIAFVFIVGLRQVNKVINEADEIDTLE